MAEWTSVVERTMARQGWEYVRDNGHRVWKKDGMTVSLPKTPSDVRGMRNTMANLKQKGVVFTTERHRRKRVAPQEQLRLSDATPAAPVDHRIIQKPRNLTPTAVSMRQVLVAGEFLKNDRLGNDTFSWSELVSAMGRLSVRWLQEDPARRQEFSAFLGSLRPDYETVFAGTFTCDYCSRPCPTPMAKGRHEQRCSKRGQTDG